MAFPGPHEKSKKFKLVGPALALGPWAQGPLDERRGAQGPWALGPWALPHGPWALPLGPWALGPGALYIGVLWALFFLLYPLLCCL